MSGIVQATTQAGENKGGHLRFRPDIEGLRAIAILFVVLFHAGMRGASGGYLGVDVFFVLSGFLITGIIVDEVIATGTLSLTNFWARRARRLLPAATFITVAVLVASAVLLSPFEQIDGAATAKAFAVYASNILFAIQSTDYFSGAATSDPLMHTWSLSVEEQFYLFFAPLLLLLAVWARTHASRPFKKWLTVITAIITLVSLLGCAYLLRLYPVVAFYILPSRVWEFGFGALALLLIGNVHRLPRLLLEVIGIGSMAGLVFSAVFLREGRTTPLGLIALLPVLCTVGVILTGAAPGGQTLTARMLSTPPLRLLGRLSYSWYLWHWPVLVFMREIVPAPSMKFSVAVAILSLIPAAATYAWIESPIRFSKYLQRHVKLTVAGAVVVAALTFGISLAAIKYANYVLATPRMAEVAAARIRPVLYSDGCLVQLLDVESPKCEYGPGTNDTTIALFGDSHASRWFPALDSVASHRGWKLVVLTKSGCPAVMVPTPNMGRPYTECDKWRTSVIARMVKTHPTLVLLSSARTYNVIIGNEQPLTDVSAVARKEWRDGLVRTLVALAPSKARVIVLEDAPRPGFNVPRCIAKHIDAPTICDVKASAALNPALSDAERAAVASVPGVAYTSLNEFMCENNICPVSRNGMVLYQDSNHISVKFAASLAPQLSAALTRAIAEQR